LYKLRRESDQGLFAKPQIISLADVTLCLLVIVLSTAGAATQFAEVILPEARNTASRDINLAVTLTVTPSGSYYFEDEKTPIASRNLWTALREIKGASPWAMALVRADKAARWQDVDLLVQCLQGLGVDEISFQMKEGEH
jgi:biopolymer transport protein ExbD